MHVLLLQCLLGLPLGHIPKQLKSKNYTKLCDTKIQRKYGHILDEIL